MTNMPYTVLPARYAKGSFVIQTRDAVDGFRGRCGWLASELKLKYVGRDRGYRASAAQVRKFEAAFLEYSL